MKLLPTLQTAYRVDIVELGLQPARASASMHLLNRTPFIMN